MRLIASSVTSSPVWDGRGGHPLLIAGDDINTVYLADSNAPLSSLIERERLDVDFPFLHLNIDTKTICMNSTSLLRKIGSSANRMCGFLEALL